ncbi:MAG: ribulokinase [Phycisphaerae bacterium]|nr:ribulokinase [Phycisphaerae bacterium]
MANQSHYTIGLDYGTNSVRALLVDVSNGRELGEAVYNYEHGQAGIVLNRDQPDLARQHPSDYLTGIERTITAAIAQASKDPSFSPERVIGLGVDTTGSTPMPVDAQGNSLAMVGSFADQPDAMAWLWKDHTAHAEAEQITNAAAKDRPQYLAKCGGRYSSEWFWAKILRCARVAPKVFDAAYTWVEIADWIPAMMAGNQHPDTIVRGVCAAGHKAMFNDSWGGYPDDQFLSSLDPRLLRIRKTLSPKTVAVDHKAGTLSKEWAAKLGLKPGIPIAVGAFDAHLGAIGAGATDGTLVKIMGTSTCDIMIAPLNKPLADVPGLCGIVPGSVLPNYYGLEAGQSAVGDIFNWFVLQVRPMGQTGNEAMTHQSLTAEALRLRPGESGLLTLDWHNGNRTVLVDQRLTGMTVGTTLRTTPAEIYRSLIEATAFGARVIMERFEEFGVAVKRVINCGGIAARSPLAMQIYADVMNRPLSISRSTQTCALGSAVAGAVVAGKSAGGYDDFSQAVGAMTAVQPQSFQPIAANVAVYEKMYGIYRKLHDAFGIRGHQADVSTVMKDLLDIRDGVCKQARSN